MRRADELIHRFLDSIGQPEGSSYVGLFSSWQSVAGERIAAHAQPVDIRGHTLIIEADHPGWVQMVMMRRERIIGELSRRFPELKITGISVRLADPARRADSERPGRSARPSRTNPQASGDPAPEPDTSASGGTTNPPSRNADEALDRIEDEQLRDLLGSLRDDLESNDADGTG